MDRIDSRNNEKLKTIRRLRRSKGKQRKARGALLEGPNLLLSALQNGVPLDMVLVTEPAAHNFEEILARCSCPVFLVDDQHLAEVADTDSPQGLVAVGQPGLLSTERLQSMTIREDSVYLYCSELMDPGNLGALARSAAAAGARALLLSEGCVQPFHPRALRASAGALLSLAVAHPIAPELPSALGLTTVALVPEGGSDLWATPIPGPVALMVGGEASGLGRALIENADRRITIPMAADTESLNATVAASIVLFELMRRRLTPEP